MTSQSTVRGELKSISTGSVEIDRRMGGGIPYRTVMLVEGPAASGKSTLAQQLLYGALTSGEQVAIYTTEQTVQSFIRQMDSLGLSVTDYFLLGYLQIFPVSLSSDETDPQVLFQELSNHIERQVNCKVIVVDALTTFVSQAGGDQILDFFGRCKAVCDSGKVVICTVHDHAFDEDSLTRVRSVCDAYLRLQVRTSGSQLLKTIEVAKIRGADMATGNIIGFQVEPGLGIKIVPISRARA